MIIILGWVISIAIFFLILSIGIRAEERNNGERAFGGLSIEFSLTMTAMVVWTFISSVWLLR